MIHEIRFSRPKLVPGTHQASPVSIHLFFAHLLFLRVDEQPGHPDHQRGPLGRVEMLQELLTLRAAGLAYRLNIGQKTPGIQSLTLETWRAGLYLPPNN